MEKLDEVLLLLQIEEMARAHGKGLEYICRDAMERLREINDELAPEPEVVEPVEPIADDSTTVEPRKEEEWHETSSTSLDETPTSPKPPASNAEGSSPEIRRTF